MKIYTNMYPQQDANGYWYVVRETNEGIDRTPFSWKTKASAENYCRNHGFDLREEI